MTSLFDAGLQPERTELAWRRTALALAVGSLIALRLLPVAFGDVLWAVCGAAGLIASASLWAAARRRILRVNAALARNGDRAPMPGAAVLLGLAMFVSAAGAAGAAVVLAMAKSV